MLCGVGGLALGLDARAPDLFLSLMLQAVAPPMMAVPALAALMGLDATLVLVTLVDFNQKASAKAPAKWENCRVCFFWKYFERMKVLPAEPADADPSQVI